MTIQYLFKHGHNYNKKFIEREGLKENVGSLILCVELSFFLL